MAVAVWPLTLPQVVLADGFQQGLGETRRSASTDVGPGKIWKRTSAATRPMPSSIRVTGSELDIFEAFVRDDLAEGSLPFTFPDPRGGSDLLVRIAPGSMPSWSTPGGDVWTVSIPLEILP